LSALLALSREGDAAGGVFVVFLMDPGKRMMVSFSSEQHAIVHGLVLGP
jgi:hypothetical protein